MASSERHKWFAAVPVSANDSFAGRLSKFGGTLSISDGALVFQPLWGLGRRRTIRLADIAGVEAFAEKPPRLRVSPRHGEPVVYMVVSKRAAPAWSGDTSARDAAVTAIRAGVAAAEGSASL